MRNSASVIRKVIYSVLILALLVAMVPYGGYLNREKTKKDLGEATIGQVDAGSFVLKLALLGGARGVAANVLWTRALDLQKVQEWDRLKQTVDLITKLQPHFLAIWTFQGWNLAYNVSVEWDAPDDKYDWIKQGITFLQEGVKRNEKSPDLVYDTAWTYYHKYGFSDEAVILRRLFRDDPDNDFKTYRDARNDDVSVLRHDNFQLGFGWFANAVEKVDRGAARMASGVRETDEVTYVDAPTQRKGRPGDLAFRSMPAHAQTRYATGLEKMSILNVKATFGEVAQNEWTNALNEWVRFGTYKFPAFNDEKQMIELDDATKPDRLGQMSDNARYWTNRWADQMNYRYWKDRCLTERTADGVQARRLFYEAAVAMEDGDFPTAVTKYGEGVKLWDQVTKGHDVYRNDELNRKDIGQIMARYLRALDMLQQKMPPDTPFQEMLKGPRDTTRDPFDAMQIIPSDVRKRILSSPSTR